MDVTSVRAEFPARPLSVDLNKVDLAVTGFWWCLRCHRVTELLDSETGLSGRRCAHCRSQRVEWKEPAAPAGPVQPPPALPEWALEPEERPKQKLHRLPSEQRDLRVLARTGYFFCYGCRQISERDEQECCTLCGSSEIEWNEPVFKEEAPS
jgi:hypothetical protein